METTTKSTRPRREMGQGTIKERVNKKGETVYYCEVMVGYDPQTGGRRREYLHSTSKTELEKQRRKLLTRRDEGMLPRRRARAQTLGDLLDEWLISVRGGIEPQSWRRHENNVNLHIRPALGHLRLEQIEREPEHVRALLAAKVAEGLSPRTVKYIRSTLKLAPDQAAEDGKVSRNVTDLASVRRVVPRLRPAERMPMTPDEMDRLFAAAEGHRLGALWVAGCYLGCRVGELLALRWSDVDWTAKNGPTITVRRNQVAAQGGEQVLSTGKTPASRRTFRVPPTALRALQEHRRRQQEEEDRAAGPGDRREIDLIFRTAHGTPIHNRNVNRIFDTVRDRAGLPGSYTPHTMRHTCASILLAANVPITRVSYILGHKNPNVTMQVYAHLISGSGDHDADLMEQWIDRYRADSRLRDEVAEVPESRAA